MSIGNIKEQIADWIQPYLDEHKMFLVDIHFSLGKHIEVYVDSDTGVNISECANLSRLIEQKLDGSGLVPENYQLDVSSPGMENPLKVPRQYMKRIGRIFDIVTVEGIVLSGKLLEADDERICIEEVLPEKKKKSKHDKETKSEAAEPRMIELNYSVIKKATLQFKF